MPFADLKSVHGNGYHSADRQATGSAWRPANGQSNHDWPAPSQANVPESDRLISLEDLAFLENLGDPADEFYNMDNSFRELLQKQFDADRTL
jgi:hypothetical protein